MLLAVMLIYLGYSINAPLWYYIVLVCWAVIRVLKNIANKE